MTFQRSVGALLMLLGSLTGCGRTALEEPKGDAALEIELGHIAAWPASVESALIRLSRQGGNTGCSGETSVFRHCWCKVAGPGCDFAGDPPPLAGVAGLCPGQWILDTTTTAVYSATACREDAVLNTKALMTPNEADVGSDGATRVNITFDSNAQATVDVSFEG